MEVFLSYVLAWQQILCKICIDFLLLQWLVLLTSSLKTRSQLEIVEPEGRVNSMLFQIKS